MNKVMTILIFFAVGAGLVWIASFSDTIQEWKIKREIIKANYCEATSDCQLASAGKCPFDCYVYVNKNEAARIGKMIENYESRCAYQCVKLEGIECVNNICQRECFGSQCKDKNSWWNRKIKLFSHNITDN